MSTWAFTCKLASNVTSCAQMSVNSLQLRRDILSFVAAVMHMKILCATPDCKSLSQTRPAKSFDSSADATNSRLTFNQAHLGDVEEAC